MWTVTSRQSTHFISEHVLLFFLLMPESKTATCVVFLNDVKMHMQIFTMYNAQRRLAVAESIKSSKTSSPHKHTTTDLWKHQVLQPKQPYRSRVAALKFEPQERIIMVATKNMHLTIGNVFHNNNLFLRVHFLKAYLLQTKTYSLDQFAT